MKVQFKMFIWLIVSVISFLLMSLSFVVMYIVFGMENPGIIVIVPGLMFYGFMSIGIISNIVMSVMRNHIIARGRIKRSNLQRAIGLICFFRNRLAIVFDIVFIISLIACVLTSVIYSGTGILSLISITVAVFSFCMHCTFNGKNFNFLIK